MINSCFSQGQTHTLTLVTPIVKDGSSGSYDDLTNKPTINGVVISGNLTLAELGAQPAGDYPSEAMTESDVDELIDSLI